MERLKKDSSFAIARLNSPIKRNRFSMLVLETQLGGIFWKHLSKHKITKGTLFIISTNIIKDFIIRLIRNI